MISDEAKNPSPNLGNTGMYYICSQLAKRGWNVMATLDPLRSGSLVDKDDPGKFEIRITE
jgi:hypothetical protein